MKIVPELAEQIQSLERRLLHPEVRRSVEALDRLLADDFLEIGASGQVYHKADILKQLPANDDVRYSMAEFNARLLSPGIVLATYQVSRTSVDTETHQRSLRSSIWRKENGQWRMLFHQGTPAAAAEFEAGERLLQR